jgi:hypothetical protein
MVGLKDGRKLRGRKLRGRKEGWMEGLNEGRGK